MTAYVVELAALEAAEAAVGGPEFTVALAAPGSAVATHFGCNWVGIPEDIARQIAALDGVTAAPRFADLVASMGLEILPPQPEQ